MPERKNGKFKLVNGFGLMVPKDYNHRTQLSRFRSTTNLSTNFCRDITDQNFSKVSVRLKPKQSLKVEIHHIEETVSSEECLYFIRSRGGILVGAQGLSLIYQVKKDKFPLGGYVISFDKKNNLFARKARPPSVQFEIDGYFETRRGYEGGHGVPHICRQSNDACDFNLGYFERKFGDSGKAYLIIVKA